MTSKKILIAIPIAFFAGIGLTLWLSNRGPAEADHDDHDTTTDEAVTYTCSMHPQIRQPEPGKCPICFMDLIPVSDDETDPNTLVMTEAAEKLADVRTAEVVRGKRSKQLRLQGRITYDETRVKQISAWLPGRIDRLYVDYTGVSVRKGDHLVDFYSPELIQAQEDFLLILKGSEQLTDDTVGLIRDTAQATVGDAREKLALLGLKPYQIQALEDTREISDRITIYAPDAGIVIEKHVNTGAYVQTGSPLYTIAELERVWLVVDAYESDLSWLHFGQEATFTVGAYPGRLFNGRISFISPTVDTATRTIKVRINVDNDDLRLKPGMFATAEVQSQTTSEGLFIDNELIGKWMCRMHPEITQNQPGDCSICGMDLVTTKSLGYSQQSGNGEEPLLIPHTAPLLTGRRAVVYVKDPNAARPTFEYREVVLGPRVEDAYIVREGLEAGELVVYRGNFKIDAERQLLARPSMMSIAGETQTTKAPQAFQAQLVTALDAYYAINEALVNDSSAKNLLDPMAQQVDAVDLKLLPDGQDVVWLKLHKRMDAALDAMAKAADVAAERAELHGLATAVIEAVETFGLPQKTFVFHCPMTAHDGGSPWLQADEDIVNPYMGSRMLKCGTLEDTLEAAQ